MFVLSTNDCYHSLWSPIMQNLPLQLVYNGHSPIYFEENHQRNVNCWKNHHLTNLENVENSSNISRFQRRPKEEESILRIWKETLSGKSTKDLIVFKTQCHDMPDPDSQTQGGSTGAVDNNSGSKHNVCLLFTVTSQMGVHFWEIYLALRKKWNWNHQNSSELLIREGGCKK